MSLYTKQKQSHRLKEQTYGCWEEGGKDRGKGYLGSLGWTCSYWYIQNG